MPPANSPQTTSTSPAPNDPLSYLSSPVPDLASTLHTHVDDEAEEANTAFLRDSLESLGRLSQEHPSSIHIDPRRDPRQPSPASSQLQPASSESVDDLSRRERLQRVLARLNRIQDPTAGSSATAYSNRTPSPNRQRLYDWAPSQNESAQQENQQLYNPVDELRREHSQGPGDFSRRRTRDATLVPAELTDAADRRERLRERRRRESEWVSLRSRAVMQRARQESSPSAGMERMLRYVMERERSGMSEEEERARNSGWWNDRYSGEQQHGSSASSREPWPVPPSASELRTRTMQERSDAMRRRYLAENAPPRLPRISVPPATSSPSSSSSQFLESALKYLNKLRSCYRYEEALSAAMDHGLATKEFFADKHDDFIMDVAEINPPMQSSWLQHCTIFEGNQHAMVTSTGLLQSRALSAASHGVEQINPNFRGLGNPALAFDHPPGSTRVQPFDASRPPFLPVPHPNQFATHFNPIAAGSAKLSEPGHDHWPVRVIIHTIDTERMTLQGTMEAYDVPQHPASVSILNSTERPKAGKKHAPITTFLEGHIIDLATHSFLTPSSAETKRSGPYATSAENSTPYTTMSDYISFPAANSHTDASNWRKLPPFNQLSSDEETARCILSKARMNEIHERYIFMRWKERCFVHSKDDKCNEVDRGSDQDRGHGLTISGFYYVSLRRSDGTVEGLYFDPTSTPYQHLMLKGQQSGWPVYKFK